MLSVTFRAVLLFIFIFYFLGEIKSGEVELDSKELRQDQEQGSGAGLSQREGLSLTSGLASGVISYFSGSPFF